ncbi:aminoacyl-tRNA hydrolase [Candidatus Peregrinibacteria bacterium]|nr:aminoacyl-tRNA hydrolase [Candidatus Peregrinibacteria bacterium]
MKIIAGLGNIGDKYAKNRHNIGFMVIDKFAEELNAEWKDDKKLQTITAKAEYQNQKLLLVKPTTLMNRSGEAIGQILNFFKESPENFLAIYDDLDLPLGKIRFRKEGSAGTHNGMKSLITHLGTENFPRLRLGIESRGVTASKAIETSDFVLSNFTSEEWPTVKTSIEMAITELKKILNQKKPEKV